VAGDPAAPPAASSSRPARSAAAAGGMADAARPAAAPALPAAKFPLQHFFARTSHATQARTAQGARGPASLEPTLPSSVAGPGHIPSPVGGTRDVPKLPNPQVGAGSPAMDLAGLQLSHLAVLQRQARTQADSTRHRATGEHVSRV